MTAWAVRPRVTADSPPGGQAAGREPVGGRPRGGPGAVHRREGRELLFCLAGAAVRSCLIRWSRCRSRRGPGLVGGRFRAAVTRPRPPWPRLCLRGTAARAAGRLTRIGPRARLAAADAGGPAARDARRRAAAAGPARPGGRAGRGPGAARRAGWRAVAYLLLKLPVGLIELYAVFFCGRRAGQPELPALVAVVPQPPAGDRLSPVPVFTPFGFRRGHVPRRDLRRHVRRVAAGAAMLLAAPWVTRAATSADAWLIRGLLGPGRLAQRVARPGAEPGAGRGRLRRPAAAARAEPARRRADPAGHAGHEPRHGQGEARRRR